MTETHSIAPVAGGLFVALLTAWCVYVGNDIIAAVGLVSVAIIAVGSAMAKALALQELA